jgi:hypothetical protein
VFAAFVAGVCKSLGPGGVLSPYLRSGQLVGGDGLEICPWPDNNSVSIEWAGLGFSKSQPLTPESESDGSIPAVV